MHHHTASRPSARRHCPPQTTRPPATTTTGDAVAGTDTGTRVATRATSGAAHRITAARFKPAGTGIPGGAAAVLRTGPETAAAASSRQIPGNVR